jgi:Response regulator containing CheY-like receiver domain and AraC-type DNA-binding domain
MGKLLLIDDSEYARELLKMILEEGGHVIVGEAANGIEGVDKYMALKPDLVILDMIMPRLNGLNTLQAIRAFDKDARVLVISADNQEEHIRKTVKEGANGYISKPYKKQAVIKEVSNIIGNPVIPIQ